MKQMIVGAAAIFLSLGSIDQVANVTLPDINTDAGLLVRVFLAESRNPGYKDYSTEVARKGMRAMKAAIVNRFNNKPEQFLAPKPASYVDIVGATNQFAGFSKNKEGKIAIGPDQQKVIDAVLKIANTGKPGKYAEFAQISIEVATAAVDDPFKDVKMVGGAESIGGTYGWKKAGSGSPGGSFVAIPESQGGIIGGNQFYTLKKD